MYGGSVIVYDTDLRAQVALTTVPHGIPALVALDANKNLACELLAGGPENPYFRLVDKEGNTAFEAPPRGDGPHDDDRFDWKAAGM